MQSQQNNQDPRGLAVDIPAEQIEACLIGGPMHLFAKLLFAFGPKMIYLDAQIIQVKGRITAPTWAATETRKNPDPAFAVPEIIETTHGLSGFPAELNPIIIAMLNWRKDGLRQHLFCRPHINQN